MATTTTPHAVRGLAQSITVSENEYGQEFWVCRAQGIRRPIATLQRTTVNPPAEITGGLRFEPQYHSHIAEIEGEPDEWIHLPSVRGEAALEWAAIALFAAAFVLARPFTPVALALVLVGMGLIVASKR